MSPRLVLAAAVFAALALGVSPAFWWLDAGELTAAGAEWGVSHPPGAHGLAPVLLAGTAIGLGSLGFRMGLVCAGLGTAAVMLLADVAARRGLREPGLWWMAAWIVLGLTFARNVRVVEIYGLSAVLTFATLWGLDPSHARGGGGEGETPASADPRFAGRPGQPAAGPRLLGVAAGTLGAWGFGDLRLVLVPLLFIVVVLAWRRGESWVKWAPLVALFASLPASSTWLASQAGPTVDWGNPQTLPSWWDHVTARSIREAFARDMFGVTSLRRTVDASAAAWRLVEDVGWLGVGLLPLACWEALRTRAAREQWWSWLFVLAGQCGYAVVINPMGGADRQTGLVAAMIVVLLVTTTAATRVRQTIDERGADRPNIATWVVASATAALTLVQPALTSWSDAAATRSWMPHAWATRALGSLPPRTLLLTQTDDLSAGVLAARGLEGARPDVVSAVAQHLHKPGPDRAWPEASEVFDAARGGRDETTRVRLATSVVGRGRALGTVAIESPSTGVLASVDAFADAGPLPLTVLAARAFPAGSSREEELVAWGEEFSAEPDRVRLAHAMVVHVEGRLARAARANERLDDEALRALESTLLRAIDVSQEAHVGALVDAAILADRRGARDEAIAWLERALAREPNRVSALVQLGRIEGASADVSVAARGRARLERAVALEPKRGGAWRALAEVCASLGDARCEANARAQTEGME